MKTAYRYTTTLLLFGIVVCRGQTNLLRNGGMESPHDIDSPFYYGMVDDRKPEEANISTTVKGLDDWEDDLAMKKKNGVVYLLHSPDWHMNNTYQESGGTPLNKLTFQEYISSWEIVQPHLGDGFVGMGTGELMQQELKPAFIQGQRYTLSLYMRPTDYVGRGAGPYDADWSQGLDLKVYLRKSRMKYSLAANAIGNKCEAEFYNKESMANTITVLDHHITLGQYPVGQWYPITLEFVAPEDSYEWLVIETEAGTVDPCTAPFLLLDDVSLVRSCEMGSCDRLDGVVLPQSNNIVSNVTPFTVSNLQNAEVVALQIFPMTGQNALWSYATACSNGVQTPIYWDGRSAAGSYVANASYIAAMLVMNNCGPKEYRYTVIKTGDPPQTANTPCTYPGIKTPIPCCGYSPDLAIDKVVLTGPDLLEYKALNKIDVAQISPVTLSNNATVLMQAGYQITLHPGFTAEAGSTYTAEIVPCKKWGKLRESDQNSPFETDGSSDMSKNSWTQDTDDETIDDEPALMSLHPNPTSDGRFVIQYHGKAPSLEITVLDMNGVVVSSFKENSAAELQVNLGERPKGMYFVKVNDGETVVVKKLVLQ